MMENDSLKRENSTLRKEIDTIKYNLMELRIAFSELQKVKTVHSVVSVAGKSSDSDAMEYTDGTSKRFLSFSEEEEIVSTCEKGSTTKKGKSSHEEEVVSGVVHDTTVTDSVTCKQNSISSSASNDEADGFFL